MVTELENAILAYDAYSASDENRLQVPAWTKNTALSQPGTDGFAASVYSKGGTEVVIAFRGTDDATFGSFATDIANGNVPAALGNHSSQVWQAIKVVADTMQAYPGAAISFTGHSLGGGLASLMAVFFNFPAFAFDPAPFALTARDESATTFNAVPVVLPSLLVNQYFQDYQIRQVQLGRAVSAAFGAYAADYATLLSPRSMYAQRSGNVAGRYLQGEILNALRSPLTMVNNDAITPVVIGTTTAGSVTLHSMPLLLAMMASDSLKDAALALPTLIALIEDKTLYARDRNDFRSDFLTKLINDQVVDGIAIAGKALDKFASDVSKVEGSSGIAQSASVRDALIVAAIEYYNTKDPAQATALFTVAGGGISFKYSDIGAKSYRSLPRLRDAVLATLSPAEQVLASGLVGKDAWHIQSGDSPLIWTAAAGATDNDAAVGGSGADLLNAGTGMDILIGGAGDDSLTGGTGTDVLLGGAGNDTYVFAAGDGPDVVLDADGVGKLMFGDQQVTGGDKAAEGYWISDPNAPGAHFTFSRVSNSLGGQDLVIGRAGSTDTITVRNWRPGQLGVSLSDTPASVTPPTSNLTGDFGKLMSGDGVTYLFDSQGNYRPDPAQPLGPQPDDITGTGAADLISGGDLNDALSGFAGDDQINGGAGDDVLMGGAGRDTLNGGAGRDYIYGSGNGYQSKPTRTDQPPPAAAGPEWSRGLGWVAFDAGSDAHGALYSILGLNVASVASDAGNIIDGGAGDDLIRAGTGVDIVHGGADNDDIVGLAGGDTLYGDDGNDNILGDGFIGPQYVEYTPPSEHGNDVIDGGAGNDSLVGQGGNDLIYGGTGDDSLYGDQALTGDVVKDDTPASAHGIDYLDGGDGNDYLEGGGRDDVLIGGLGNDTLYGDADPTTLPAEYHGEDLLDGGDGADYLAGGGNNDVLSGGAGNDTLIGDTSAPGKSDMIRGVDLLDGGDGDDSLVGGALSDTLYGGAGNDSLRGDDDLAIVAGADQESDYLDGGDGNDYLQGDGQADVLIGGAGNDTLYGDRDPATLPAASHGADVLDGGDGVDYLEGGGNDDTLSGGAGNDTLIGDTSAPGKSDTIRGVDVLDGGVGDDYLAGGALGDTLYGGDGDDTLVGDDALSVVAEADQGDDYLDGGAGNDTLVGGGGADRLFGGDGADLLFGDASDTPVSAQLGDYLDGGAGDDQLSGDGGDDVLLGGDGNDALFGGDGADAMEGDAGNDSLSGGDGGDSVLGDDGDDTLFGGIGSDLLSGGAGTDYLYGDAGDDTLDGGSGADYLAGGAGDDTYLFSAADLQPATGVVDGIFDNQGTDTVVLEDGFALADVALSYSTSGALQLSNASTGIALSIANVAAGASSVRQFQFSDGQVLSTAALIGQKYASVVNVSSQAGNAYLAGGTQNDMIFATGANSTLSGGLGNDILSGASSESTTYLFGRGDGNDSIGDRSTQNADGSSPRNTLILSGINLSDLQIADSATSSGGGSLKLLVNNGGGSIGLGAFDPSDIVGGRTLDAIQFGDGTTQTWLELVAALGVDISGTSTGYTSTVAGTGFNDRITGGSDNETITAGAGDDRIDGGSGNDTMDGGTGSDTYVFGPGSGQDTINNSDTASDKVDRLLIDGSLLPAQVQLIRYEASLIVRVTGSSDQVLVNNFFAGAGVDQIVFGDGTVYTPANTPLNSGASQATAGDDLIYGAPTNDTIDALAGNDTVLAGSGDDVVSGNDGNDVLYGDAGDDVLDGGRGSDVLHGGNGNDTLTGGQIELDTLYGDAGNDWLSGDGTLDGGDGNDVLVATAGTRYAQLYGGNGDDQLTGSANYDELFGGAGNDTLTAGGGADRLTGGVGSDTYVVRRGDNVVIVQDDSSVGRVDTLRFGAGITPSQLSFSSNSFGDLILTIAASGSSPAASLSLGAYLVDDASTKKLDQIIFDADPGTVWTAAQIEAMAMGPSDADQYIRGTLGNDSLNGYGGIDYIYGRDGDDTILGGAGNDQMDGGAGNDVIEGDAGNDSITGGAGSDTLVYNLGDGSDTIGVRDSVVSSIDSVMFGPGILPGNVTVRRSSNYTPNDMLLSVYDPTTGAYSGSVTIIDGFNDVYGSDLIDQVTFASAPGTVWTRATLQQLTLTGSNAGETLTGYAADDTINGNGGNDYLDGGAGNDDLTGGAGNDQVIGGAGDDTFHFGHTQGIDEISDTSGSNRIVLDSGIVPSDVTLYRTSSIGPVTPNGSMPAITSDGLVLVLSGSGEQIWMDNFYSGQSPWPVNQIVFADGAVWDATTIDAHTVNQAGTVNSMTGTASDDAFTVDHRGDVITEAANAGTDSVTSSVTYTLPANVENLTLTGTLDLNGTGNGLTNTLTGNAASNTLDGGAGTDNLAGGVGDDTYVVDTTRTNYFWDQSPELWNFLDVVSEQAGQGYDAVVAKNVYSATLPANVEQLVISGMLSGFSVSWTLATDDVRRKFTGNALDNVIDATAAGSAGFGVGYTSPAGYDEGEIVLDGGAGADVLIGPGNNLKTRYVVDNVNDVVVVKGTRIDDRVESSVSYTLGAGADYLDLTGTAAINGTGNSLNNTINGSLNSAANVLSGGAGNDTFILGAGDSVVENALEGIDTVQAGFSHTLGSNLENLTLTGTGNYAGTGNALNNVITGNSGANALVGGAGDDTLAGGLGSDSYGGFGIATGVDVINDSGGTDTIVFDSSQDIGADQLAISRSGNDLVIAASGQSAITVQSWYANASNVVEQLQTYEQGLLYTYTSAQVQGRADGANTAPAVNAAPAAPDAQTGVQYVLQLAANTFADIESQHSLAYSAKVADGSALPSWLTFDSATRTFTGTPPTGSQGSLSIAVTAADAGGLSASTVFALNIQLGPIMGTPGNDNLVGDASDNVMEGLGGDDSLDGQGGNDSIYGGLGNDTMLGGTGDDYLDDWGSDGYGGNDYLDGGTGADTMYGGDGNDIYIVDNAGDLVSEDQGGGTDEVRSSVTFTLDVDLDNLTLTGTSAINGTGNTLDNVLTGNSGNNTLTGLAGNDTLYGGSAGTDVLVGGTGNDSYTVDRTTGITITENASEGTDLVNTSVTYTLGSNLENLTLTGTSAINGTGNTLANVIAGNSANNTLNGGTGADTLIGGAGNDTYTVDNTGDAVTENGNEGTDLVNSSVTYTIGANVENLTLTGSSAINGTGNTGNNVLTGNSGNNALTGLAGNDTLDAGTAGTDVLMGGTGNDTYIVGRTTGITITENAGEGTDLVNASVTYTLGTNVENLTLTGTTAINGTGNTLDNVLTGNSGNNTLTGLAGNDTLYGGSSGTDVLVGGTGNDIYTVDRTSGITITENASEGTDLVNSSVTHTLAANVENLTLTGASAINGTGNTLANVITGNSANNTLDGGTGVDTLIGGAGNDTYTVDNTADVVTENANEGTDLVNAAATYTIGANIENLTLTGATALSGTGNTLNNVLTGNSGNNTLTGLAGNDTLYGGSAGTDVLVGGTGDDIYTVDRTTGITITENAGEGTDLVNASVTHTLANNVENLTLTGTTAINGTGNTLDNVLTGNSGNNTLTGLVGNDTLYGGTAGTDVLVGGTGDDTYTVDRTTGITITENASEGVDRVNASVTQTLAANIDLLFLTGTSAINGTGNALANLLRGNLGVNTLVGGGGTDILEGGDGNDILSNASGNTLLNGGLGADTLTGTANNDLLIGGAGNDTLTTGSGADIIVFNKGDGQDTVAASTTKDNTLAVGGGTLYADLLFQKSGNDLILKVGASDQITFTGYYASTSNHSVNTLQVVIEGTADYNAGSPNAMNNKKVETFNFDALVTAFDAARTADPNLTSWALTSALAAQYLSGSDTAALGGDLAYQYARNGNLSNISFTPAIGILGATSFGSSAQTLQSLPSLQDSTVRLS